MSLALSLSLSRCTSSEPTSSRSVGLRGEAFRHSLTSKEEISLAHIHKNSFSSLALSQLQSLANAGVAKLQRRRRRRRWLSYRSIDHQGRKKRVELTLQ